MEENVQRLLDEYRETDYPEEAISEMAATFDNRQAMLIAAGTADDAQAQQASIELFETWKGVCQRHGVNGEYARKGLVLRGMAQYIEDSKNQSIALMANRLAEM